MPNPLHEHFCFLQNRKDGLRTLKYLKYMYYFYYNHLIEIALSPLGNQIWSLLVNLANYQENIFQLLCHKNNTIFKKWGCKNSARRTSEKPTKHFPEVRKTFSKSILSESTDGKGIVIDTITAGSGRPVHAAVSSTADFDEVWIYACNSHTSSVNLTLEFGGTSSSERISQPIDPSSGLYLVVPGFVVQNGAVISAYASELNKISIYGFVNRIVA